MRGVSGLNGRCLWLPVGSRVVPGADVVDMGAGAGAGAGADADSAGTF